MEVRAAGLVQDVGNTLSVDRTREFTELSGRQWEVVTRLVDGQRVPEIARSMYLSPSTVRNHLTVVFRKFGVHSQRELVALLTNAARSTS
jgi:DNA-binding NarL/FixJ family response regulator